MTVKDVKTLDSPAVLWQSGDMDLVILLAGLFVGAFLVVVVGGVKDIEAK